MKKTPILLAMMIIATGQVGVSIYLPSLPLISNSLNVGQADVQLLVTVFLVAFGLSQLFYGPLSDAIGRRPVFILGQGIYLAATVLCIAFADNLTILILGRFLQGLGAGSASVLGRSVLRDSYEGAQLTKALSYISITASIMPIIAPVMGGWIAFYLGWEAVFMFVLLYLIAIFTLGYFVLPETMTYGKTRFNLLSVIKNYGTLVKNKQVISSASYNWVTYLTCVVSLSVMPFILQHQLGLTAAEYGSVMIIPSGGLMMGSLLLNIVNRYLNTKQILGLAISTMMIAGLWLLVTEVTLFNLVWAFTLLTIAQGLATPISISMLLEPHKRQAGSVSALSGAVQMCLSGVLGGYLVEHWVNSQMNMGVFYLISATTMGLVLLFSKKMLVAQQKFA
ncbi:multidrug effflux MFS transporter [Vibrio bivalvicida]|uniref:Bcr/CflA family efflux transporter n=1 Tax=Vibrio bivalvicida TaxID=1276888 RepID=A0ABV4MD45_9VIBR